MTQTMKIFPYCNVKSGNVGRPELRESQREMAAQLDVQPENPIRPKKAKEEATQCNEIYWSEEFYSGVCPSL